MNALVSIRSSGTAVPQAKREHVAQQLSGQLFKKVKAPSVEMQSSNTAAASSAASTKAATTQEASQESQIGPAMNQELGKDAFLQLLVMQLQNQDPLEPQDNAQMIAQLAQFSTLEQMNNLTQSFHALSASVMQSNFVAASNLLGKTVLGMDIDGNPLEGVVERIAMDVSGNVNLIVNGSQMPLQNLFSVVNE